MFAVNRKTATRFASPLLTASVASIVLSCVMAPAQAGETRTVEGLDFEELLILGSIKVEVKQGSPAELQIQGSEDFLEPLPFSVRGSTLVIGRHSWANNKHAHELRYRVIVPELSELRLKGSGSVYVKPFVSDNPDPDLPFTVSLEGSGGIMMYSINYPSVELKVKGSGKVKVETLDAKELEAVVAGSGDLFVGTLSTTDAEITITGSGDVAVTEPSYTDTVEINVIGSGDARLKNLFCDTAELNVVGSGDISLGEVATKLNASILGSGDIRYGGNPRVEKVELGSGEVRRRD